MSKMYVPNSLSEYLGESKSITLKRKYGERPTVTAGTQAPLRNQVLSFVAENASVSKLDLKRFIVGLKEGGSTPAAANMFIKRNAKYFVTESRNGITYFKLSNLGQRLVSRFQSSPIISESKNPLNDKFKKLNERFVEDKQIDGELEELPIGAEETPAVEFEDDRFEEPIPFDQEIDEPDEEIENEEPEEGEDGEGEGENFDYYEDDEKIVLTYYKTDEEPEIESADELDQEDLEEPEDDEFEETEELDEEEDEDFDADGASRPHDEYREYDFKDKGRPGILDVDESMEAQFVSHKLTGKKSSKLGGKLGKEWHNLLDDNQDKDENELKEANNLGGKIKGMHNLLSDKDEDDPKFDDLEDEITESIEPKSKLEQIIENIKAARKAALNEAETVADEKDELTDKDLSDVGGDEKPEEEPMEDTEEDDIESPEDEVEKVEITEFIITVDNVDSAIDELKELGVTAERVPIEPKEEEVPAPVDEEPEKEEKPAEEPPVDKVSEEPVKESMNEADEDLDLGTNDELNLGDQGEKADELDLGDETMEPTTEFEENKLKVKAEDWPVLKSWLEEKGVDVTEMFGGEIEMEEVPEEEPEEEVNAPVSDDDIDFSGVGDEDKTKVENKEEHKE